MHTFDRLELVNITNKNEIEMIKNGGIIMPDLITSALISTGLKGLFTYCGKGLVSAFNSLSEYCGNAKAPLYDCVSSFWYDGVSNDNEDKKIYPGNVIRLNGVVSQFIPLCPRHPRSIPGKQANTWINLYNAEKAGTQKLDFMTQDFIIWNDGVIVPPISIARKAILGLSDKYGYVGHGCLPLIIDLTDKKLSDIYMKLVDEQPVGYEATVKGRVTPFTIDVAKDFGLAYNSNSIGSDEYPNYVLEIFEIQLKNRHNILTGTMWIGYEDNRIFPIYCHLLDKSEYRRALTALSAEYKSDYGKVVAVHDIDPYKLVNDGVPKLNEYLINILNNY